MELLRELLKILSKTTRNPNKYSVESWRNSRRNRWGNSWGAFREKKNSKSFPDELIYQWFYDSDVRNSGGIPGETCEKDSSENFCTTAGRISAETTLGIPEKYLIQEIPEKLLKQISGKNTLEGIHEVIPGESARLSWRTLAIFSSNLMAGFPKELSNIFLNFWRNFR